VEMSVSHDGVFAAVVLREKTAIARVRKIRNALLILFEDNCEIKTNWSHI